MSTEAAELLEKAAEILETDGWCQYSYANSAGEHCALGAMIKASGCEHPWQLWGQRPFQEAVEAIAFHHPVSRRHPVFRDDVADWNDQNDRTAAEVIDAFKQAAKDLRNEAKPE